MRRYMYPNTSCMIFLNLFQGSPMVLKRKFLRLTGLIFFSLLVSRNADSQYYPIHRYSVSEGLSHSNVFRIMQDKNGFIWCSTNYGFSCFNGREFKNYTSENGLRNNVIMSVTELNDGRKVICSFHGLHYLEGDSIHYDEQLAQHLPDKMVY